ncbi:hypothetical protein ERJ70_06170 [Sediminibacillus dalangtanensis]|uniref:SnoaL-like domain-containing protein n=1 Tax=Sediminibacillus dalangtanensis TaxID=2729421 RepID=A0ABX7VTW5_9BACI|nr:hypothetical protein [Sediminibacillus dalangtanensis]QTM98923.1 hypothetical protein ERJ70_06170 [Sediminibacillus dalangtanensis]
MINHYYQSLINGKYEDAFDVLYLYDYQENTNEHLSTGTALTEAEAKDFYMKKTAFLKEQNYAIKDYEISEVEYADGHTFWHHISITAEVNGKREEYHEIAQIWKGKLLVGEREDPYVRFRDGKMNITLQTPSKAR